MNFSAASSGPSPETFPKVVVVGAGMAGLVTTKELRRRGWPRDRVVLLEATSTIGGRVRTRRHRSGFLYDAGAMYVHGTIGNPIAALAKEAGITLKQVSANNPWMEGTSSVAMYVNGVRASEAEVADTAKSFSILMGMVMTRANQCDDPYVAFSDVVADILLTEPFVSMSASEMARLQLRLAAMALWHGSDLQDLQLMEFGSDTDTERVPVVGQGGYGDYPGPHCIIDGGAGRLVDAVATEEVLECLRLDSAVHSITTLWDGHKINPVGNDICDHHSTVSDRSGLPTGEQNEGRTAASTVGPVTTSGGQAAVEGGVAVKTTGPGESAVIHADAVVVAVPLSLLQRGAIEFDPPFPEKAISAISRLRMGRYEKFIVEFRKAFWPADVPFIACCPQRPSLLPVSLPDDCPDASATTSSISPVFLENYLWSKGVPVLAAAVSGQRAREVSTECCLHAGTVRKDYPVVDATGEETRALELYRRLILPAIQDSFGAGAGTIPEPVSIVVTGWWDDPCQRGSYSFFPLGAQSDDIFTAGQGVASDASGLTTASNEAGAPCRVFLAGEATSVEFEGSMHGAYLSGLRAAEDVAYALGLPP